MIVYILGKMLGTEGLLLLIPAVVSLLYKEKTGVYFLVVAAVLFALYLGLGRFYDDRIYYFAEYRGSSERNEFLAVLYTLDRRNGSARFCDDDHFS